MTTITTEIKLWGIVQGVGFRPFVAKVANRLGMKGKVLNIGGLVEITVTDTEERIDSFIDTLVQEKPEPSEIVHIRRQPVEHRDFDSFEIIRSDDGDDEAAMIPADLAMCPHCLEELYDAENPRYLHPFISCMECGPRYTIIDRIPYDRDNTSMIDFPMCDFCESQYTDLHDRRHHAQTISCHQCGPQLLWESYNNPGDTDSEQNYTSYGTGLAQDFHSIPSQIAGSCDAVREQHIIASDYVSKLSRDQNNRILDKVAELLKNGKVIAFKSVGGYNLVASPFNRKAVTTLRNIKNRESKPFAVMFRSLEEISRYCTFNEVEAKLLKSSARPIILLEHKLSDDAAPVLNGKCNAEKANPSSCSGREASDSAYYDDLKRSRFIGSFLPSFAAQYLLLDRISPLIFTSANPSELPMIKDDAEMVAFIDRINSKDAGADIGQTSEADIGHKSETDIEQASETGIAYESETGIQQSVNLFSDHNYEPLISGMLYNERKIRVRADDSVCRVIDGQPQMIRRSKGYAPVPLYIEAGSKSGRCAGDIQTDNGRCRSNDCAHKNSTARCILATGGQLKNSFALSKGPFAYMSQYFGDMDTVENQDIYRENIRRMSELFRITPEMVVCDMHPLYFSTGFAYEYARTIGSAHERRVTFAKSSADLLNDTQQNGPDLRKKLPVMMIQHHHAHVASVMAENNLKGPVIGVSFDGTGYGTDGKIWGGEFLLCQGAQMRRMSHLKYVKMIGGDSSIKDALRSALSYVASALSDSDDTVVQNHNAVTSSYETTITSESSAEAHKKEESVPQCREISVEISDIIKFGADRITKETNSELILKAIESGINTVESSSMGRLFDAVSCLLGIQDYNHYEGQCAIMLEDAAAFALKHPGEDKASDLALSFHERIIDMILAECVIIREETGANQVALSGGTFQNKILMEGALEKLRSNGFQPYYNISVSPNDGGLALGQLFVAMNSIEIEPADSDTSDI